MGDRRKKIAKIIIFIFLMCAMVANIYILTIRNVQVDAEISQNDLVPLDNVGGIEGNTQITQTFIADEDFCGVKLYAAIFGKISYGDLHLQLREADTNKVIAEKTYDMLSIQDNAYHTFLFDEEVKVEEQKEYKLLITCDKGVLSSTPTLWRTEKDDYTDGVLYINDQLQGNDLVFEVVYNAEETMAWGMLFHRVTLVVLLFVFLGLHCFVDIKKMYDWIFRKRVWIAIGFFVFMVLNKYNYSSMEQWDVYVQPGEGSQYAESVFGEPRAIRSDEWMVSLPRLMSGEFSDYGKYNEIVRATKSSNLSASGLYCNYSALAQPANWGFYLFGTEYGVSFLWNFNMIFGFLFSFELCYILSKNNRLLSLMGASLIWFSGYNMWWSTVNWLLTGPAALVFAYYFLTEEKRGRRIFFGAGTAIFAASFVVNLYPAWQVPAGYLFAMILLWMLIYNREKLKQYQWKDWGILAVLIVFMASIVAVYMRDNMEYLTDVMNTVYPGSRVCYGGNSIRRLMEYIPNLLMTVHIYENASEAGRFITFFPIPYLLAAVVFFKNKKKDLLTGLLLLPTTLLSIYCLVELPAAVAKGLLLTYTTPERASDVLGYAMLLLLIVVLGRYEEKARLKFPLAATVTVLTLAVTLLHVRKQYAGYSNFVYFAVLGVGLAVLFTCIISKIDKQWRQRAMVLMSICVVVAGAMINPIMCGTDVITSKPVAKEIKKIVKENPDGKWISMNSAVHGNFLITCGAPTINSANYVPNMELWEKLDPEKEQEEIYNRYAHIIIRLAEDGMREMELKQADLIEAHLTFEDLKTWGVKYVYSVDKIEDSRFKQLYYHNKAYIYEIVE